MWKHLGCGLLQIPPWGSGEDQCREAGRFQKSAESDRRASVASCWDVRLGSWSRGGNVALCSRGHCDAGTTAQQRPLLNRALLYSLRHQEKVK